MFLKQGQHRDVQAQRRDVPEGLFANVATLRSNVTMSQGVYKANVVTFQRVVQTNVATLQRGVQKKDSQRRDVEIQRREMIDA